MVRFLLFAGLLLGVLATGAGPSSAQQFRNAPVNAPPIPQVQNNFNNVLQQQQNQKIVGYNVTGINGQGVVGQNGLPGTTASNIINGMNNGGGLYGTTPPLNPYASALNPVNPYANNAALSPYNYNTMMYGTPYGPMPAYPPYGYPPAPYYNPYANPYPFLGTGTVAGMSGGPVGAMPYPSPAQLYNFNLNFAYLNNPYINPMSNPAFSGPFPAGVFNAAAALNLMGMGNILQQAPLNPNGLGGTGAPGNNNSPFP